MAAESKLETYFKKRVKELGGETRKVKWIGRRYAPDRLAWVPIKGGFSFWAELKSPGKPLTAGQAREHKRMKKMGFRVMKIDSKEQIDLVLFPKRLYG